MIAFSAALGVLFPPPSFVKTSVMFTAAIAFCNKVLYNSFESVSLVSSLQHEAMSWKARGEFTRNRSKPTFYSEEDEAVSLLIHEGTSLSYMLKEFVGLRLAADDRGDLIEEQP